MSDEAARAEALILDELAGKTYPQVERLAWRAALAVAPDVAERRRAAGERQARVTVFREDSGAVGLSGRDLPAAEALAGPRQRAWPAPASTRRRARSATSQAARLEAIAYRRPAQRGQRSGADRVRRQRRPRNRPPAPARTARTATATAPTAPEATATAQGRTTAPAPAAIRTRPARTTATAGPQRRRARPGRAGSDGDGGAGGPEDSQPPASPLAEVTVPLATLQHRAERAGDSRLLGPLDPALARDLAAAAARSPVSRWEITIVDEHGYAVGHGLARPARGAGPQPQPPPALPRSALPARVNITITETFLHQLQAQAAQPRSGAAAGRLGTHPREPRNLATYPARRPALAVRFDVVPVYGCDHRYQVSSYRPGDRLRRLVQVRDHECTWPPCSRPARETDFEHAVPYGQGGVT